MYNPQLKTFLAVADAGSFSKAAAQQYITAPALIKQINTLEKNIGVTLFERTHRGLELTEAGRVLYQEAKLIIQHCNSAANRIRQIANRNPNTVRVGFSPLTPAHILTDLLPQLQQRCPGLRVEMVPFVNNVANAIDILTHLGQDIDVVVGIFDSGMLDLRSCNGIELFQEPFCCAVPINHHLSQKAALTMQDLYGEELMIIHRGWGRQTDMMLDDFQKYPEIHVTTFDSFEIGIFNQCVNNGAILVAISSWENVHPQMKLIPVDWGYSIPFGLLHSPEPSASVRQLLNALQNLFA